MYKLLPLHKRGDTSTYQHSISNVIVGPHGDAACYLITHRTTIGKMLRYTAQYYDGCGDLARAGLLPRDVRWVTLAEGVHRRVAERAVRAHFEATYGQLNSQAGHPSGRSARPITQPYPQPQAPAARPGLASTTSVRPPVGAPAKAQAAWVAGDLVAARALLLREPLPPQLRADLTRTLGNDRPTPALAAAVEAAVRVLNNRKT